MLFLPVVRAGHDHALLVTAAMAAKENPYVRVELPLTPGAIELADLSRYTGVTFDVRGEGQCKFLVSSYLVRNTDSYAAPFTASDQWQTIKIPFSDLRRRSEIGRWEAKDGRALLFELSAPPSSTAWMELDNVRFY